MPGAAGDRAPRQRRRALARGHGCDGGRGCERSSGSTLQLEPTHGLSFRVLFRVSFRVLTKNCLGFCLGFRLGLRATLQLEPAHGPSATSTGNLHGTLNKGGEARAKASRKRLSYHVAYQKVHRGVGRNNVDVHGVQLRKIEKSRKSIIRRK